MSLRRGTFARIVIPSPLKEPLTYSVPLEFVDQLQPGMRVLVPLGKRKVTGVALGLLNETELTSVRDILAVQDDKPIIDGDLICLCEWLSRYYLVGLGSVFETILPPLLRRETQRTVVGNSGVFAIDNSIEEKILQTLHENNNRMALKTLAGKNQRRGFKRALERLEAAGAIEIRERFPGHRETSSNRSSAAVAIETKFRLNAEQQTALNAIASRLLTGGFETFLLHGVTGSGKTEVYLGAMEQVRAAGRQSLVLTPEISLTPQLLHRVSARFPGRVGVLHSGLTATERWSEWRHISDGTVDIVVGARSAVFAPLPSLGLIIVDEEHDTSYKQEEGLRYNGRDVAVVRGKFLGCPVLLGSATPSLESYENCRQGRYRLLEMAHRVQERPLPAIRVIDLRKQVKSVAQLTNHASGNIQNGAAESISDPLADALKLNFEQHRQTLIFLNRRGFANFLQCRRCGYVWRCSHCSVAVTLHLKRNAVRCHHCEFSRPATRICPECGNETLDAIGVGTEQVERMLETLFPSGRIARMDRDTVAKRGSHKELLRRWEKGELDIIVGTQMITKGHDVAGVTLVGVLLADMSLNLPDFRSAERTFQILCQVAGRCGRGDNPGNVLIQTYAPEHYAVQSVVTHDYRGFFLAETESRRALGYPPFGKLVNLRLDGPKLDDVEAKARALVDELRAYQRKTPRDENQIEILGPAPAPIEKLRNRYRWQILLKGRKISGLLELAILARNTFRQARKVRLHIDVDPYNML
jgi:primosomal protein N' (replication factor Y) (superfamily II helicase)